MGCRVKRLINQQAVLLKHNKPRPRVAHRCILCIAQFLGIDEKCTQVVPWSLHTFPENFMPFSRNLASKETKI